MKSSFVILLFILWATLSLAQPGAYDPTFDIGSGFNGQVRTVVVQNNGKILVGGFFTSYKSNTANRIIRLENDGNVDNTFVVGAGFNAMVRTIAVQSNGKILVGGDFTNFHLTPINRIIRLEADGSVDASFNANVGTGFDQEVNIVAIQPNGKILVGGDFTSYNTTSVGRLVRLESNGSIDAGFNAGGAGFNSWVTAIAVQSNGKIIVGGVYKLQWRFKKPHSSP
ncbi:MAG: delta-60 repeat domain-containing protein [Raineya sp.]|nr:delta-60 repeat domain-containing protein [Raineya sp.]